MRAAFGPPRAIMFNGLLLHESPPPSSAAPSFIQRVPSTSALAMSTAPAAEYSVILGGDYAGLHATFSSKCPGGLVPVPERLVPRAMLEWGDIPSCLEALTSEDWTVADTNDENGGGGVSVPRMFRTVVTVLPEVGCGIDNLEVTRRSEDVASHALRRFESWGSARDDIRGRAERREVAVLNRGSGTALEIETVFQVDSDAADDDDDEEDGRTTTRSRRIRVSLSLDIPRRTEAVAEEEEERDIALSNLIDLRVERRVSPHSTRGTAWTGPAYDSGGLDARTVTRTIGRSIVYGDAFAVKKRKGGDEDPWTLDGATDPLGGSWTRTLIFPARRDDDDVKAIGVLRADADFAPGETPSVVALRLPQNIMLRYGRGVSPGRAWEIEISHLSTIIGDGESRVQRRVVLRSK
ncbi:hypothetical protein ACHAW5_004837 [Stephanodiscus triporus]|uniref:Uncharacterized protein n=1 Tax=Stephanodiscus triporus TaxID=2934178 RepID=A0ABD3MHX0_9STRA